MRVKSLHIKNFKRFTDFKIQGIPQNTKLVLLIGSNGSGKSSVFDAFELLSSQNGKSPRQADLKFIKNPSLKVTVLIDTYEYGIEGSDGEKAKFTRSGNLNSFSFYGRPSFRQVPRLTKISMGERFDIKDDDDRPVSFIDRDLRFENDLEHLFGKLLKEFFRTENDKSQIKKDVIDPVNESLSRIFGNQNGTKLELIEIIPPLEGKIADINFKKGNTVFHYNYLSAGEKEVFNILINLIARQEYYQDTIYFLDEIDLHLNTILQYNLLKEITEYWIPERSQLWTASHSLGFIEYAKKVEHAAIIDFDSFDFDLPKTLIPLSKESLEVYDIAIPKEILKYILRGAKPVIVENTNDEYYNLALAEKGYLFLPANNNMQVFLAVKADKNTLGLRDKDYLRPDEIAAINKLYPNLRVLEFYSFENYIYHPDNIDELKSAGFDKQSYVQQILSAKNAKLLTIASQIATSRQTYVEFKEGIKNDNNIESIINALQSNDFETFYPYFNMKKFFDRNFMSSFNLQIKDLVSTSWFKNQIIKLLQ